MMLLLWIDLWLLAPKSGFKSLVPCCERGILSSRAVLYLPPPRAGALGPGTPPPKGPPWSLVVGGGCAVVWAIGAVGVLFLVAAAANWACFVWVVLGV